MAMEESTKIRALNEGKALLQKYGYNGFSFQHIADALGLKKQSLYVHFKSKEELGEDLIESYRQNFKTWSETVEIFGPEDKINALLDRFYRFLQDDLKYCPISALASDFNSLPKNMQKKLTQVAKIREEWTLNVIKEGQNKKVFRKDFKAENLAQIVIACGFGTQITGRLSGEPEKCRDAAKDLLKLLKAE